MKMSIFVTALLALISVAFAQKDPFNGINSADPFAGKEGAKKALAEAWKKAQGDKNFDPEKWQNDPKVQEMLSRLTDGKTMDELKEKYEREERIRNERHRQQLMNPPRLKGEEEKYAQQLLKDPTAQPSQLLLDLRKAKEHHTKHGSFRVGWNWRKWHNWVLLLTAITVVCIMIATCVYIYKEQKKKDAKTAIKYQKLMGGSGKMPTETSTFLYDENDNDDDGELMPKPQDNPNLVRRNKVSLS